MLTLVPEMTQRDTPLFKVAESTTQYRDTVPASPLAPRGRKKSWVWRTPAALDIVDNSRPRNEL